MQLVRRSGHHRAEGLSVRTVQLVRRSGHHRAEGLSGTIGDGRLGNARVQPAIERVVALDARHYARFVHEHARNGGVLFRERAVGALARTQSRAGIAGACGLEAAGAVRAAEAAECHTLRSAPPRGAAGRARLGQGVLMVRRELDERMRHPVGLVQLCACRGRAGPVGGDRVRVGALRSDADGAELANAGEGQGLAARLLLLLVAHDDEARAAVRARKRQNVRHLRGRVDDEKVKDGRLGARRLRSCRARLAVRQREDFGALKRGKSDDARSNRVVHVRNRRVRRAQQQLLDAVVEVARAHLDGAALPVRVARGAHRVHALLARRHFVDGLRADERCGAAGRADAEHAMTHGDARARRGQVAPSIQLLRAQRGRLAHQLAHADRRSEAVAGTAAVAGARGGGVSSGAEVVDAREKRQNSGALDGVDADAQRLQFG